MVERSELLVADVEEVSDAERPKYLDDAAVLFVQRYMGLTGGALKV